MIAARNMCTSLEQKCSGNRLANVDCLRILAIIAVVFLHIDACYTYAILPATRFAVPLFFMTTGYFLGEQGRENWKKYIIDAFWVLIGATLFYGLLEVVGSIYNHTNMLEWPWGKILVKWVVFNQNPFHYHLWFLGAYLYVLCIAALVDKCQVWKWVYWLIIPLFVARFCLQCIDIPIYISRNFLFIGLPCFLVGSWLRNRSHLYETFNYSTLIVVCLLWSCLPFAEDYLLSHYLGVQYGDFITAYMLSALLLVAAVRLPQLRAQYIPKNTRNMVLGVYIFHPFVHFVYRHVPYANEWVAPDAWFSPIIVFITTWLLCAIVPAGKSAPKIIREDKLNQLL